jgi:5-methylcytosine-specific restriction endonuclease McrA
MAVSLLMRDKAMGYDDTDCIEIQTVHNIFRLPRVIILTKYVHIPFSIATPTKRNICKRDNHQCAYCGKQLKDSEATIDHIVPRSKGGKHEWTNVAIACSRCNCKKGSRSLSETGMKLRVTPRAPSRAELI